ncbi:hypothetical protein QJQ45_005831 [Haematococcus lacustris]|nr:hypothetical protein QJQ45_005831 [Haematococcus lacustris]
MQRIGESKWRPLELCYWPEQGKLPAKGKEYPGLGYKRLRDKPPKAKQQPAAAQAVGTLVYEVEGEGQRAGHGEQAQQEHGLDTQLLPSQDGQEECQAGLCGLHRGRQPGEKGPAGEGESLGQLEEDMAAVSMERHGRAKQLVVFFGAASIGTRGGWGADAVLRACRKVVCRPRGTDQRRGRVVLVDEHRTTRVSSAVNGQQPSPRKPPQAPRSSQEASHPAASEQGPSSPLPAKRSKRTKAEQPAEPTQPTKGKGKAQGKAAKAKPAPQPGRWLDRDCNAALNMQRIGESKWRPLELCYWPEQGKLPAKGKEYPGLGYKRLRDKPPKAQQQPAAAQ